MEKEERQYFICQQIYYAIRHLDRINKYQHITSENMLVRKTYDRMQVVSGIDRSTSILLLINNRKYLRKTSKEAMKLSEERWEEINRKGECA